MCFKRTNLNFLILLLATLISNGILFNSSQANDNTSPIILVSVEPLYEIVSSLSHGIVKPKVIYLNFHDRYKPLSPWQKKLIHSADIIIRAGRGFEPLLDDYLKQQKQTLSNKTITLSQYIPLLDKEGVDNVLASNRQEKSDLRFWMDPRLVKMLAIYLAPRLVVMDPDHQENYLDNEIVLKDQLKKVEDKMLLLFKQLSTEQKILFAQFNPYLKNRYLSFAEIKEISPYLKSQPDVINCIEENSFDALPLNLEYTEKALYSLLQALEQCSKIKISSRTHLN
ncbi:MAG: zinc ABC transporter substrate-binding protein [Gammaproteobacteria bacterium]|nr:zinc ABC transporter substrate-binding protein [Gammaproteobacteria bacterium]